MYNWKDKNLIVVQHLTDKTAMLKANRFPMGKLQDIKNYCLEICFGLDVT